MSTRTLGRSSPIRVAIADDTGLLFSDDYRNGWVWGFKAMGCEVMTFDISKLRSYRRIRSGPYSSGSARGLPKMIGQNVAGWRPDLVWCHHGRAASNEQFLAMVHKYGAISAVYLCDEPYEVGETAGYSPYFKSVFTMDPCTMEAHRLSRPKRDNVFYLPPAVNNEMFKRVPYADRKKGGAFFLGNAGLIPRPGWLKPVENVLGADIRYWPGVVSKIRSVNKTDKEWIPLEKHPEIYGDCYVGLNVHRHPGITNECYQKRVLHRRRHMAVPKGINLVSAPPKEEGTGFWNDADLPSAHVCPRFFEMASCGTLVVSDDSRSELARMFPMAPRAQDPQHFLELCKYYLDRPKEAEQIGEACSYLISKRHTYRHRAAEVLIRLGLRDSGEASLVSSLGEPADWLTLQHFPSLKEMSLSAATGRSERWSPASGLSLTERSGKVSEASSLDAPTPWLA